MFDENGIHLKLLKENSSATIIAQPPRVLTYNPMTGDILFVLDKDLYIRYNSSGSVNATLKQPFLSRACVNWHSTGHSFGGGMKKIHFNVLK